MKVQRIELDSLVSGQCTSPCRSSTVSAWLPHPSPSLHWCWPITHHRTALLEHEVIRRAAVAANLHKTDKLTHLLPHRPGEVCTVTTRRSCATRWHCPWILTQIYILIARRQQSYIFRRVHKVSSAAALHVAICTHHPACQSPILIQAIRYYSATCI